jgi:selenide,water dikinase
MTNHPRPKAGVFAVRQGKPLFHNLRRTLQGKPPRPFHPQRQYLSLIGTGDGCAIASRGPFGWQSRWLWRWKDYIDRSFMAKFSQLPQMKAEGREDGEMVRWQDSEQTHPPHHPMHCAGCGAKVGSTILERTLTRIQTPNSPPASLLLGLDTPDDAAVIQVPAGKVLVQTIDYFPALLNDPFIFGQIAANHALSDLFAMGAAAHSALAIASIPYGTAAAVEETLYQVLSGAVRVLQQANAVLIGGHTIEAPDLAFGLSCNGLADPNRLLPKAGMQPGQALILTKAIGTGTLFAAQMQRRAKAGWIDAAVDSMLQSNQQAATCFLEHAATACTDVTGFGLLGHLLEMIRASNVAASLNLAAIPLLQGAQDTVNLGITSSLQPQNLRASQWISNLTQIHQHPRFPLLFDPQTSGGLLASVPQPFATACLAALHHSGYTHSTIIGYTTPVSDPTALVTIAPE